MQNHISYQRFAFKNDILIQEFARKHLYPSYVLGWQHQFITPRPNWNGNPKRTSRFNQIYYSFKKESFLSTLKRQNANGSTVVAVSFRRAFALRLAKYRKWRRLRSRFGWRQKHIMVPLHTHIRAQKFSISISFIQKLLSFSDSLYDTFFSLAFISPLFAEPRSVTIHDTRESCTVKKIGSERSSVGWGAGAQRRVWVRSPRTSRQFFTVFFFVFSKKMETFSSVQLSF